jgi:hypothetical protein
MHKKLNSKVFKVSLKNIRTSIMKKNKPEDCTRTTVKTDDGNFYLVVGDDFVIGTVPRENDPLMSKTRNIVETICAEITRVMKIRKSSRNIKKSIV